MPYQKVHKVPQKNSSSASLKSKREKREMIRLLLHSQDRVDDSRGPRGQTPHPSSQNSRETSSDTFIGIEARTGPASRSLT